PRRARVPDREGQDVAHLRRGHLRALDAARCRAHVGGAAESDRRGAAVRRGSRVLVVGGAAAARAGALPRRGTPAAVPPARRLALAPARGAGSLPRRRRGPAGSRAGALGARLGAEARTDVARIRATELPEGRRPGAARP